MSAQSLEVLLRKMTDTNKVWCELATITSLEDNVSFGYLLNLTLQPSGKEIQARHIPIGVGPLQGAFWPIAIGAEVLVLMPRGEYNQAIAIGPLHSKLTPPPTDYNTGPATFTNATGFEFRSASGIPTKSLVTEDLLVDLRSSLQEIQALLAGLGLVSPITGVFLGKLTTLYKTISLKGD